MDCNSLESVTFPRFMTEIEDKAFYGCSALTSLEFPKSVKTIGRDAFGRCNKLRTIIFYGRPPSDLKETGLDVGRINNIKVLDEL